MLILVFFSPQQRFSGTEECPIRSVVNRVGGQLFRALSEKGVALLVNHGIPEEKVSRLVLIPTLLIAV